MMNFKMAASACAVILISVTIGLESLTAATPPSTPISPSATATPSISINPSFTETPSTPINQPATAAPSTSINPSITAAPSTPIKPSFTSTPSTPINPSATYSPNTNATAVNSTSDASKSVTPTTPSVTAPRNGGKEVGSNTFIYILTTVLSIFSYFKQSFVQNGPFVFK